MNTAVYERKWWCEKCPRTDITYRPDEVKFHDCAGMFGLAMPMTPKGQRAHFVVNDRQDYSGGDTLTVVDGHAVQSVEVMVGNDQKHLILFPGSANLRLAVEEVEDLCPSQVRRKGRASMREWLSTNLRRNPT